MHCIYQPLWHIPVYTNTFWISQSWECVQQDAGRGHEECGQGLWTSYLDDILTFSSEPWAHFRHLTQVVLAHVAAGIKIQPCKTKLFQSEVEYLGHKISKGGVSMIPEYVQKITDWPLPKTGKEVATFLGFARYYQTFVRQYSALTNRLNGIKKVEKFLWNKEIK